MSSRNKKLALLPVLGLDSSKSAEYIDDRATPVCENISIDRYTLQKRIGTSQLGSSASERLLAYKELYTGGSYNLLRVGLTIVESMNYSTGAWTDRANAALTADSTYRVNSALPLLSGSKIMVFTNYKDNIRKWVGGASNDADLGGSPPKAKFCLDFGSYLLLAYINDGGNDYPMRVQWSDTGAPETWTGGNSGSKELTEDGRDITGLALFGNYAAVHKETAIYLGYLVATSTIFKFERKSTGAGAVNFATIQNLPTGEQIFLARDGIHLFNGVSAPLIPSPIMDELKDGLNPEYIHKCWSAVVEEKDEYWVGLPIGSQTEPETVYKYNYRTGQCYKDSRIGITAIGKYTASTQATWGDQIGTWQQAIGAWNDVSILKLFPNIILGDSAGVSSKRDNVNNDISTAISAYWESKDYESDIKGQFARWLKMEVWAKGNTVKVEYSTDRGSTWITATTLALSADYPTDSSPLLVFFDVVSSKIRFRFSNNIASETFTLKQFITHYRAREMR